MNLAIQPNSQIIKFENTFAALGDAFGKNVHPEQVGNPQLRAWNDELAAELNFDIDNIPDNESVLAQIFSGNLVQTSSVPMACVYSGHQFGHFSPVLGDGRAHLLGEIVTGKGKRHDIQLKGSGRTPFSRSGDGKSSLGPVLREYLLSESMHALGVPTTRALAAVSSGETVYRQQAEPGGIFTRVSESLIRVGTFQYFASVGDLESLGRLLNYVVNRNYPDIADSDNLPLDFFRQAVSGQAQLVAKWMSYGFIHGVMNTDNSSVAGLTIDYGPCAFMDETNLGKVFSSIDRQGRYSYQNQPEIGQWNMARLAETLIPLFSVPKNQAIELLTPVLGDYMQEYELACNTLMLRKIGIHDIDDESIRLLNEWLKYLERESLDFTLSFRHLPGLFEEANKNDYFKMTEDLNSFLIRWVPKIESQNIDLGHIKSRMDQVNPLFIPRNHQVQRAIEIAFEGDFSVFQDLQTVMKNPFQNQEQYRSYAEPPTVSERITATFCGT